MSLPSRNEILARIGEWDEIVDRSIATGVHRHIGRIGEWDSYEWVASLDELLNLGNQRDAAYDRPTIGPAYALWYHARRVNPLISQVEEILREVDQHGHRQVDIVDLGAGTGAVAWAAALVAAAVGEFDGDPPRVVVHEVESSPLMTATADALWEVLGEELDVFGFVERRPQSVSWPLARVESNNPTWLLASFLLDHTDKDRREEMAKALRQVIDGCRAEGVLFTVSSSKRETADSALAELERDGAWESRRRVPPTPWSGVMRHCAEARRALYGSAGIPASLANNPPTFNEKGSLAVREARRPIGAQPTLFSSKTWMALTDEQEAAAGHDLGRSVLTLGAAGSGKSIVLVERLARLLTRPHVGSARRVLVTTFNKDMITQLSTWLAQRLDHEGIRCQPRNFGDTHTVFEDIGAGRDRVELLNWDKAPSRLFEVAASGHQTDAAWRKAAAATTAELLKDKSRFGSIDAWDESAQPEFQLDEVRRVIYGLGATNWSTYREVERVGRRVGLPRSGPSRELIWRVFEQTDPLVFLARRLAMLAKVRSGSVEAVFTDVYVDEYQDFLPSDIECLTALLDGSGAAFYAGDEAQAVHLGLSYHRPRPPEGNWVSGRIVRLAGSHRLPIPIADCLRPLAEAAQAARSENNRSGEDVALPTSRKAAVIGVRPILVVGTPDELGEHVRTIVETYRGYLHAEAGTDRVTVCESDSALANAIGTPGIETTTVKKIKGLERGLVVWSARKPPGAIDEAYETAYTAMTRTSCLLVIAVEPSTLPAVHLEVLRHLAGDHVMRWDQAAEDWWTQVVLGRSALASPGRNGPDAEPPAPVRQPNDPQPSRGGPAVARAVPEADRASWDAGEECAKHELAWCSLCKPRRLPPVVHATDGGSAAFHGDPGCQALAAGQRRVADTGGEPALIEAMALESAIGSGRFPCLICFPDEKGRL